MRYQNTVRTTMRLLFISTLCVTPISHSDNIIIVSDVDDLQSDVEMIAHLEALGHTVSLHDEGEDDPVDLSGQDMLILSSPISSGNVAGAYRDIDIPILTTEYGVTDEMNISGGGGNQTAGIIEVEIINNEHPITQGLPLDFVFILTDTGAEPPLLYMAGSDANPNAPGWDILSITLENENFIFLAALEREAELNTGLSSINRRVFYGIPNDGYFFLDVDGWRIFDQAIDWLLSTTETPVVQWELY